MSKMRRACLPFMKKHLHAAAKQWRKEGCPLPGDGYMQSLRWKTVKNDKGHVQVDLVRDSRYKHPVFIRIDYFPHDWRWKGQLYYTVPVDLKTGRVCWKLGAVA